MLRTANTEYGKVRGLPAANPRITVYKGIPFAAPPIGENRWRVPQPAESWEGVRNCFEFAPAASQQIPGQDFNNMYIREFWVDPNFAQGEDCLYLNVWTPANSTDEKLPVMIWIYGGGMQCGYTSEMEFNGENIAKRGVILVSIPYRVTAFGYLAHPELTTEARARGEGVTNFGLYDQQYAIQWVRRNIANFGGDPDNITIFGQSAGGRSVLFQSMSPLNHEGDIKRLITQSGGGISAISSYGYPQLDEAEEMGKKFFEFMGVKTLAEARALDTETVRKAAVTFHEGRFGVTIDKEFVPDHPSRLLADNRRLQIPIMCGHTTGDMNRPLPFTTKEDFTAYIEKTYPAAAAKILALAGSGDLEEMKAAVHINNQRQGNELLAMRAADAGLDAYFYAFDGEMPGDDHANAFHSSELWFVFETLGLCWRPFEGRHYDLARQICNYWTNFAKTGDPNGDDHGKPMPRWEKFTAEKPHSMRFGEKPVMDETGEAPAAQAVLDALADELWRK